jgi:hypothetical protein
MIDNFLNNSDFKGRYIIPLARGNNTDEFNDLVTECQYDTLIDLMGYPIYKEFEDGLAVTPTPEARWTNLRDGVEYTDCHGYLNNWQGIKYMLIPFTWVKNYFNEQYKASQFGIISNPPKNAILVSDFNLKLKLHNYQNEAIKRYREAYLFMYSNLTDYNDFTTFYKPKFFNQIITKGSIS